MATSPAAPRRPCPTCGEPASLGQDNASRPFCSERCRTRDLLRWFDEDYRIAGTPVDPDAILPTHDDDV